MLLTGTHLASEVPAYVVGGFVGVILFIFFFARARREADELIATYDEAPSEPLKNRS
jgi:hypothetical protein